MPEPTALDSETPEQKTTNRWFFPGVDGLRGAAILSVLFYHANFTSRGLFGVDVFFVVSGFFITLLLLRELDRSGRIRLGQFYLRRAKRLVPGLVIVLALTLWAVWAWGSLPELEAAGTKTTWSLLQLANWQQISSNEAYWSSTGPIQPLAHMWSLSITEQFYLVWPVLLIMVWFLARKKAAFAAVGFVVIALTVGAVAPMMWNGENSDRLYLGTDSRAVGFAAGAAAAAIVFAAIQARHQKRVNNNPPQASVAWSGVVTALSLASLGAVVYASVVTTSYYEAWLYQGGLAAVAGTAALFTATLCSPANLLTRPFSWKPLAVVGRMSYTIYLVHLPMFWLIQKQIPTIAPLLLFAGGSIATIAASAIIHHLFTEPMRKGRWRAKGVTVLIVSVALLLAGSTWLPERQAAALQSTTLTTTDAERGYSLTAGHAGGRPMLLVLGDSLAQDLGRAVSEQGTGSWAVSDGGWGGCGVFDPDDKVRKSSGEVSSGRDACPDPIERIVDYIGWNAPDVILIHSSWDALDQYYEGQWLAPTSPQWKARYRQQMDAVFEAVSASAPQSKVVLVNDRLTNGYLSDPASMVAFNAFLEDYAAEKGAPVLNLRDTRCPEGECKTLDGAGAEIFLADNVHLSEAGMAALSPWIESELAAIHNANQ